MWSINHSPNSNILGEKSQQKRGKESNCLHGYDATHRCWGRRCRHRAGRRAASLPFGLASLGIDAAASNLHVFYGLWLKSHCIQKRRVVELTWKTAERRVK
ncbi:hypothetical protein Aduo_001839 [Ancylostoma duodenale]